MTMDPETQGSDMDRDNLLGEEPGEESGGGYGNHAPDVAEEPSAPDKDAR